LDLSDPFLCKRWTPVSSLLSSFFLPIWLPLFVFCPTWLVLMFVTLFCKSHSP
jgi:hypothetical protein